jgi:hypothetical protein
MSKYPTLDKVEFAAGRQYRKAFIETERRRNHGLPTGTAALLEASLLRAQGHWERYEGHVAEYGLDDVSSAIRADDGRISAFAWEFRPTVTHLTLAAELIAEFHWVLRLQYAPQDGETMNSEQRRFANLGNQTINLMAKVVDHLTATPPNPKKTRQAETDQMYRFLFEYAQHLAKLGIKVCEPENYAFHHPKAAEWHDRLARLQETIAASVRAQAQKQRDMAKRLRGQPVEVEPVEAEPVREEAPPRRYLNFFPVGSDIYKNCQRLEHPVFCDIIELGDGTVTALDAEGAPALLKLSDYDVVYVDTDMMDAAHGRERRQEIVEHIRKHGLTAEEVFKVEFFAGPLVDCPTEEVDHDGDED